MDTYCPNYHCNKRSQQESATVCTNCKTSLIIGNNYRLTGAIRTSPNKVNSEEYCWYELFPAQTKDRKDVIIKILVIVPEASDISSSAEDISNIKRRFEREYQLLSKGLPGICRAYEILDVPIEDGSVQMRAIVMEKVAGINLDEYVERHGAIDSQQAFRWLQQLVKTIGTMHNHQIQHRDIKPSNIMISGDAPNEKLTLIDFGVALDKSSSKNDNTAVLGTDGYVAPEYLADSFDRQYRNEYDFYSLGRTFVRLLKPKDWFSATPLDPKLQEIIQRMIEPGKRFQSAEEILRCLKDRNKPRWLQPSEIRKILKVKLLLMYFLCALGIVYLTQSLTEVATKRQYQSDSSSALLVSGGRSVFNKPSSQVKEDAFEAFRQKDWQLATQKFGESLAQEKQRDPETVIFQQNALIAQQDSVSIVVVVPIGSNLDVSKEILRGVAYKQQEINEKSGIGGKKLKVYIADDANNENKAKEIATEVVKTEDVLAVVGSNATTPSQAAAGIYQDKQLVMISPTAFDSKVNTNRTYIFRAAPTADFVAKKFALATAGLATKMAICVDAGSNDNEAFSNAYTSERRKLSESVNVVNIDCRIDKDNAKKKIEEFVKAKADSILIAPHIDHIERIDSFIQANNAQSKKLAVFGTPTMYMQKILEKEVVGMIFPAWWNPEMPGAEKFAEKMQKYWKGTVNWRSATAYDAVSAIVAGGESCVKKSIPDARDCLKQKLLSEDFSVPGSIGFIKFDKSGNRIMNDIAILKVELLGAKHLPKKIKIIGLNSD
jgi:branched-chain amino acid transport system substrate-binding protein